MSPWLAVSVALAGPDAPTLDRIARLEWDRQDPVQLRTQIVGGDAETRVAAVRALGRLRSPDAIDSLVAWMDDPEPKVRRAVAESLGWTPGGAERLRFWWLRREGESPEVVAAILVGLGRQGDARDVQSLIAAMRERGVVGVAAARALGTLSSHGVNGLEVAVEPLIDHLDPLDADRFDTVAWALARIRKPIPERAVPAVLRALDSGPSPEARAWLVKAVWATLPEPERTDRFLVGMTDAPRLVQVAVLGALLPEDAEPFVLAGFLADRDPWIRYAAIDAVGRHPDPSREEVLRTHLARTDDPWEQARVVMALGVSDPAAAADPALPVLVRAAWVQELADPGLLVKYATESPEPAVRTAAVGAWAEREGPAAAEVTALLAASDALVRQVAFDRAGTLAPKVGAPLVRDALRTEQDAEARAQGWATLDTLFAADKRSLPSRDPKTRATLAALSTGDPLTLERAARVAKGLGLPPAAATTQTVPATWTIPGGEPLEVASRPESLTAVRQIRSARVTTDQGEFILGLDPFRAPLAVATFAALAEGDYFDGLVFHRVVPGFVAQTGCPRGDGWGGPGFTLPDEDSEVLFEVGSLGMAREDRRDTGGSQWFVTTSDQPHLTSEYTRFGQVVQGLYVVQALRQGAVIEDVVIERVP